MRLLRNEAQVFPRSIARRTGLGRLEGGKRFIFDKDCGKENNEGGEKDEQTEVWVQCCSFRRFFDFDRQRAIVWLSDIETHSVLRGSKLDLEDFNCNQNIKVVIYASTASSDGQFNHSFLPI
jgi:hypothetical protein